MLMNPEFYSNTSTSEDTLHMQFFFLLSSYFSSEFVNSIKDIFVNFCSLQFYSVDVNAVSHKLVARAGVTVS